MMSNLDEFIKDPAVVGKSYCHGDKTFKLAKADNFEYTDPIDGSVAKKQVSVIQRGFVLKYFLSILSFQLYYSTRLQNSLF